MKSFGQFKGYESEVYVFEVSPGMVLEAVVVPKTGAKDRDFVIVPERQLMETARSLKHLGYSRLLDDHYAYIPADGMVIDLQTAVADTMTSKPRQVRFAVVRWNRKSQAPFPRELTCLAHVAEGSGSMPVNRTREIIAASPNKK